MKVNTRWLDWDLLAGTTVPTPGMEPSTPSKIIFEGFEGSLSGQMQKISAPEAELVAYQDTFDEWILKQCVFRDRSWGGVRVLHKHYALWCGQQGCDVPAGLDTFVKLLRDVGSFMKDDFLIYGIILREDVEHWKTDRGN